MIESQFPVRSGQRSFSTQGIPEAREFTPARGQAAFNRRVLCRLMIAARV
jgi:hypothetical protein